MNNSTASDTSNLPLAQFTSQDAGKVAGSAQGDLPLNYQVSINGNSNLSSIIVGNSGAYVQTITYTPIDGIARNAELNVYGRGPAGMGSGSLTVTVVTANGTHDLSLTSSTPQWHTDKFDDGADIISILWNPT